MTRWVYLRVQGNPVFLVWVFWLWLRPLLCCFAVFPAGETQIWPGDLRVVAVWPGFCLSLFGFAVNCGTKVFHIASLLFTRFSHC